MKTLFLVLTLLPFLNSYSQTTDTAAKSEKVFIMVEQEARFPGGVMGWKNYLEQNLNTDLASRYIKLKKSETEKTQTAILQFIVNAEGFVSDVKVTNPEEVHPKLAAEAIRVIKEGPRWQPATQNHKAVTYQAKQYITFLVARE